MHASTCKSMCYDGCVSQNSASILISDPYSCIIQFWRSLESQNIDIGSVSVRKPFSSRPYLYRYDIFSTVERCFSRLKNISHDSYRMNYCHRMTRLTHSLKRIISIDEMIGIPRDRSEVLSTDSSSSFLSLELPGRPLSLSSSYQVD
jgi:hypothetical protein